MQLLDDALAARQRGDMEQSMSLQKLALEKERAAADSVAGNLDQEPTRSILHRSAATIALDAGEYALAEHLICRALIGRPTSDIAEELRDLLEQVYFRRHLSLRGIELENDEFQMSISGTDVGYGITRTDTFLQRVSSVEKLLYRTAERKLQRPYRSAGAVAKKFKDELEVYLSVPRAASFAVSFKLGRSLQIQFEGLSFAERVVDEVLECFSIFNSARERELRERIPDPAYYTNFVGLARSIAPDGKEIKVVGFTSVRQGKAQEVALTLDQSRVPLQMLTAVPPTPGGEPPRVRVEGRLAFADALRPDKSQIKVSPAKGRPVTIIVPEGMMDDIVRPLWDTDVIVTAVRDGKDLKLVEIDPASADSNDADSEPI